MSFLAGENKTGLELTTIYKIANEDYLTITYLILSSFSETAGYLYFIENLMTTTCLIPDFFKKIV